MTRIVLTKEDCFCDIMQFYKNVAIKSGIDPYFIEDVTFDCTDICVSKQVMNEIFSYYEKVHHASDYAIVVHWVKYGPKVTVTDDGYIAEFNESFMAVDIPLF